MAVATESQSSTNTLLGNFDKYVEQRKEIIASLEGTMPAEAKKLTKALEKEVKVASEFRDIIKQVNENGASLSNQELADLGQQARDLSVKLRNVLYSKGREALDRQKQILLDDSIDVKQEGTKYTVLTKPPRADMTLMDVFKQLACKVNTAHIKKNFPSVDLNEKLGSKEVKLIVFYKPGTQKENHAFIKERGFSLDIDPKRVLYMAAVLQKKDIDGNLNKAQNSLYNILQTKFIRFGSGSDSVHVGDDNVLYADEDYNPNSDYGVPCVDAQPGRRNQNNSDFRGPYLN